MSTNIIELYPIDNPLPPTFTMALQRWQETQDEINAARALHQTMTNDYGSNLPAVIPLWWSQERIQHFANRGQHQPMHVATVSNRVNIREKRLARRRAERLGAVAA